MPRPRILLAHGNADCRKIYASVLEYDGCDVLVTADAESAMAILGGIRLDLLVTDLYLPSGDDECLLRCVRRHALLRDFPVMVLTGWTTEPHRRLALEHRANAFFAMPLSPRDLSAAVRRELHGDLPAIISSRPPAPSHSPQAAPRA